MQADKKKILNRLATIEGHFRGIRKMVEDDQYCVDILKQSYAVERALKAFEAALLDGHLNSCVAEASGRAATRRWSVSWPSCSRSPESRYDHGNRHEHHQPRDHSPGHG